MQWKVFLLQLCRLGTVVVADYLLTTEPGDAFDVVAADIPAFSDVLHVLGVVEIVEIDFAVFLTDIAEGAKEFVPGDEVGGRTFEDADGCIDDCCVVVLGHRFPYGSIP